MAESVEGQFSVTLDKTEWGRGRGGASGGALPMAGLSSGKEGGILKIFQTEDNRYIIEHVALSVMMK